MNSSEAFLHLLAGAQSELDQAFPPLEAPVAGRAAEVLAQAARRMADNFPYAHPLYAGQMLKPPHPVARAAYAMATAVNPNNHALDGGRASSAMEIEAVAEIAAMFGFPQHLGHLTSSGTFANLEALWVAGQTHPGKAIAASAQAHYTHERISGVLGLPFHKIAVDSANRMDLVALEAALATGAIGTVVVTLGTTSSGAVDPLDQILKLRDRYAFRIHVDSAYGGYFVLAGNLAPPARLAYDAIAHADSLVVDPHKHGLQPYGCGCVLFRDPAVGRLYRHDSPYTYFTSGALHLGEISLECSRAGAAAVALWTTQKLLPLTRDGEFAGGLASCRSAALALYQRLQPEFLVPVAAPQLDIVVWACPGATLAESSARAQQIFDRAAALGLHLALARLPVAIFPPGTWPAGTWPADPSLADPSPADPSPAEPDVLCLRSVLMKWEHLAWLDSIHGLIRQAADF